MSRKSTLITDLPRETLTEVTDMLRSGVTLDNITQFLQARGYQISRSAVGRYAQQTAGTEGVLLSWARRDPKGAARLARLLEGSPQGGFSVTSPAIFPFPAARSATRRGWKVRPI